MAAIGGEEQVLCDLRPTPHGSIAVVTLNRPDHLNPLDAETVTKFRAQIDDLAADPSVRAVVVTGAPPAFSAGGDLRRYLDLYRDKAAFRAFLEDIHAAFNQLERSRLLSIAAVNGTCVAGGFELALSCDLIVMARGARMGDGHLHFWQLPGGGGTQRLPRAVGFARAKRLLFSAELFEADAWLSMGVAAAVFESDTFLEEACALAEKVIEVPEDTILRLKKLLIAAAERPLHEGLAAEIDEVVAYATESSGAAYEGLLRFAERRSSDR